jgi:hypothetical protein
METKLIIALALIAGYLVCLAKTSSLSSANQPGSDAQSASSDASGVQFPKIDSQRRAYFRIAAPGAKRLPLGFPGAVDSCFVTKSECKMTNNPKSHEN